MDPSVISQLNADCARITQAGAGAYLAACEELVFLRTQRPADHGERLSQLRALGAETGAVIAEANLLVEESGRQIAGVWPADADPRTIQPLLRALGDSLVLLLAVRDLDDIDRLPFADPNLILRALESPQVTHYLATHDPEG